MSNYTVRKFAVTGQLSDHDFQRVLLELDTQHRNKNKFIHIERIRRKLVRQAQAEHPTIGVLTAEYNQLSGQKAERLKQVQKPFDRQLTAVNAQIRDAKNAKRSATALVAKRKQLEKARKQAGAQASEDLTEKLAELANRIRAAKQHEKDKIERIRAQAEPVRAAIAEINAQLIDADRATRAKLAAHKRQLKDKLREIRARANEHNIYAEIDAQTEELKKLACRDLSAEEASQYGFKFGLAGHSGTKWWIKDNADQASKARSDNLSAAHDPEWRLFPAHYLKDEIREGTLCAGLNQSGPVGPIASFNSPHKGKLFIPAPPPSSAYDRAARRCYRKRAQKTDVYFRIGTAKVYDEEQKKMVNKPEWIHLPNVCFHHEIPDGAIIVEALLKMECVGARRKLWVIFTLKVEPPKPVIPTTMDSCVIRAETQVGDGALVFARSESPHESRVLWHNTDPRRKIRTWKKLNKACGVKRDPNDRLMRFVNGRWVPDKKLSDMYTYAENLLRTQNDWLICMPDGSSKPTKHGGERKGSRFATTVLGYIASGAKLPHCLAEAADNNIFKWRSTGRLQRLYRRWIRERVEGDEEAFAAMQAWAAQDLHLYHWARSMEARLTRRKVDTFRKEAIRLCRTYKTLYIDDVEATEREDGFTDEQAAERTKWQKRAGFGLFREILKRTAKRCGTEIIDGVPQSIAA